MKKYLILFLISACISCSEEVKIETKPPDILSHAEMVDLLVDVQLIQGGIIIRKLEEHEYDTQINVHYQSTFKEHGLTKASFDYNMRYYSEHTDELEKIYEEVINELSRLQAKSESKQAIKK